MNPDQLNLLIDPDDVTVELRSGLVTVCMLTPKGEFCICKEDFGYGPEDLKILKPIWAEDLMKSYESLT